MKFLIAALSGAIVLAGCAGQSVKNQDQGATQAKKADVVTQRTVSEIDPLTDPKSILSQRSIFFGYDQYAVNKSYNTALEAHAKYLNSHSAANITIEGNTDERGSSEYNLALGNRRAESVKKVLAVYGAPEKQIEVVSLGKEKPKADCHEESCWSQNRRADIVYNKGK